MANSFLLGSTSLSVLYRGVDLLARYKGTSPEWTTPPVVDPGVFDPNSLSPFAWWDAADTSTITTDSSNNTVRWNDKSGGGRSMTIGAGAPKTGLRQINNKNAISFTASGDRMQTAAETPGSGWGIGDSTVFVVFQRDTTSGDGMLICGTTGDGLSLLSTASNLTWRHRNSGVSPYTGEHTQGLTADLQPHIARATRNSTAYRQKIDSANVFGNQNGGLSDVNAEFISVGSQGTTYRAFAGLIAEIIIYKRELTFREADQVEAYLAAKWNVAAYVPAVTADNLLTKAPSWWLDASDASTFQLVDDGGVSKVRQWFDKSGNAKNLVTSDLSVTKRATYKAADPLAGGKPSVSATDAKSVLVTGVLNTDGSPGGSSTLAMQEVYVVTAAMTGVETLFNPANLWQGGGDGYAALFGSPTGSNGAPRQMGNLNTATWIGSGTFSTTSARNGGSASSTVLALPLSALRFTNTASNTTVQRCLLNQDAASTRAWKGPVCEVIAFPVPRTAIEQEKITQYMQKKWGIA